VAQSLRDLVFHFDWSQSEPLQSTLCIPAAALSLAVCLALGYPATGVMMASGAMCVGFGSFQKPLFTRSGPMIAAGVGITISAMVGALCAHNTWALVCVTVVWGFVYGLANSMGPAAAWVGMECCIYLIVSSAAPAAQGSTQDVTSQALLRGAGIFSGALLQYLFIRLAWIWVPRAASTFTDPEFDPNHLRLAFVRQQLTVHSVYFRFGIRLAITAFASVAVYRHLNFNNAYWVAMTAMMLPKPELVLTTQRTIHRFAGTLLGAGLATVIAVFLHPSGAVLTALVLVFLWCAFALLRVNYGVFVVAITGYIAFILAILHAPQQQTLEHRIEATLIGGAIGLTIHLVSLFGRKILGRRGAEI